MLLREATNDPQLAWHSIHRAEDQGDILLFLTGQEEIKDVCQKIKIEADDL